MFPNRASLVARARSCAPKRQPRSASCWRVRRMKLALVIAPFWKLAAGSRFNPVLDAAAGRARRATQWGDGPSLTPQGFGVGDPPKPFAHGEVDRVAAFLAALRAADPCRRGFPVGTGETPRGARFQRRNRPPGGPSQAGSRSWAGTLSPKLEWLRVRQQGAQSCPNPE
jgi:hypothetical protein